MANKQKELDRAIFEKMKTFAWNDARLVFKQLHKTILSTKKGILGELYTKYIQYCDFKEDHVVAIVYYVLAGLLWGIMGLILGVIILVYCLGPHDLYSTFETYFMAVVRDDKEERSRALKNLLCITPEKPEDEARELTKASFSWFNSGILPCHRCQGQGLAEREL